MPQKKVTKEAFFELLSAVHNIHDAAECDDKEGENVNSAAMTAAHILFALLDNPNKGYRRGVELTVRLLAEVNCSANPAAYVEQETRRGDEGIRHMDREAGIKLPENVPFRKFEESESTRGR